MKRRLVQLLTALLVTGLLALAIADMVRDSLVRPIWEQALIFRGLVESLNQETLWYLSLFVAFLATGAGLLRLRGQRARFTEIHSRRRGRVEELSEWVEMIPTSPYFRWRVARYLGELTLRTLARTDGLTEEEVNNRLRRGDLDLRTDLYGYLLSGLSPGFRVREFPWARIRKRKGGTGPTEIAPVILVNYLESKLEHEHSDSTQ